jgi:hypothetical protein
MVDNHIVNNRIEWCQLLNVQRTAYCEWKTTAIPERLNFPPDHMILFLLAVILPGVNRLDYPLRGMA